MSGFIAAGYNNKTMRLVTDVRRTKEGGPQYATMAHRGKVTEAAEETLWTSVYNTVQYCITSTRP